VLFTRRVLPLLSLGYISPARQGFVAAGAGAEEDEEENDARHQ